MNFEFGFSMTIRTKITLTFVALVVIGVGLVSMLSSWQIQKYLEQRTVQNLKDQLEVLSELFINGDLAVDSTGARDEELTRISRTLKIRLSVIRKDGVVIYDSDVPRDSLIHLENHSTRPEIVQARLEGRGMNRRKSVSVNEDFLYAARMITNTKSGSLDSSYVRTALLLGEISEIDRRVQIIIWGVGVLAVLFSTLASFQVSKRVTKPILGIGSIAQDIISGHLDHRVTVTQNDEIGTLGRTINEMADKLSSDIMQLRKLERVRSEFLGNVSHELRTPIFSMQGFIETLLDGAVDDASVNREFLEKAHRQSERLNALLNDLIEISRIESGDMKMSFRYFEVEEFVRSTVEELKAQAEKKQLSLEVRLESTSGVRVYGDKERLKQVLVNLVDNAIKYTDAGGSVVCRVSVDGPSVVFSVEDTGTGIAEEHLQRIFERFYRVDRDRSREVGGTGLGLAIVKHIVEAHESTVSVTSTPGQGSVFTFRLRQ